MNAIEKLVLWLVLILVAGVAYSHDKWSVREITVTPARTMACVKAIREQRSPTGVWFVPCGVLSPRAYPHAWYYAGRDV